MEAVEELTGLRKNHASLQEKYKEIQLAASRLRTERDCLRDTESRLAKYRSFENACLLERLLRRQIVELKRRPRDQESTS